MYRNGISESKAMFILNSISIIMTFLKLEVNYSQLSSFLLVISSKITLSTEIADTDSLY